ncbi:MAG: hypothetical protein OQJ99_03205 [Rhodospirillales bacterium]|nr:hypothetical protein [Rhodospirillales bacterium]
MLYEWVSYLTTPCPRHLRAMGFLREQIGIVSRYRRCAEDWAPHVEKTGGVILAAAGRCRTKGRALILGAGPGFDLPLNALCAGFEEVVLADVLHPRPLRRRAAAYPNLRLLTLDVIGILEPLYAFVRAGGKGDLPDPRSAPDFTAGYDLVASVNLLSQLPVFPREYLEGETQLSSEVLDAYCGAIVETHLERMAGAEGVACLISDYSRILGRSGIVSSRRNTLYEAVLPFGGLSWTWNLAPRPEQDPHNDVSLLVRGYSDLKAALARDLSTR